MKKLLITGSCSFIYGNFIRKLIYDQNQQPPQDRKYTITSVDRISNNAVNNMYSSKNHVFHPADIRDRHIMDVIFQFEQPDIVIHAAAESSVDNSITDPNAFITTNVLGTQVIINCCLKHKVQKLIYISSDEVMGQLLNEQEAPWTEESPLNPRNPYSSSKACGELLVKAAHETHGLTYNITRSSNCYGPRQLPEKLIPKAIKYILEGKKIPIYGKGLQIRDWTYVGDHCSAIMTILDKGLPNEVYNISANQEFNNLEVIHEICKYMDVEDQVELIKDPRGGGHDFRYSVDSSKLRKLGWSPQAQFKRDLGELCINWYLQNKYFLK